MKRADFPIRVVPSSRSPPGLASAPAGGIEIGAGRLDALLADPGSEVA